MWSFNPLANPGIQLPTTPESTKRRTVAIIGDDSTGKTSFIYCKLQGSLPPQMLPPTTSSLLHAVPTTSGVGELHGFIDVWDTAGFSGYERARAAVYKNADVVVIMFDRNREETLKHIPEYWFPEVKQNTNAAQPPIIVLVGNKTPPQKSAVFGSALVQPMTKKTVGPGQAEAVARSVDAVKYLKCSVENQKGVNEAFDEIINLAIYGPPLLPVNWCQTMCTCVIM